MLAGNVHFNPGGHLKRHGVDDAAKDPKLQGVFDLRRVIAPGGVGGKPQAAFVIQLGRVDFAPGYLQRDESGLRRDLQELRRTVEKQPPGHGMGAGGRVNPGDRVFGGHGRRHAVEAHVLGPERRAAGKRDEAVGIKAPALAEAHARRLHANVQHVGPKTALVVEGAVNEGTALRLVAVKRPLHPGLQGLRHRLLGERRGAGLHRDDGNQVQGEGAKEGTQRARCRTGGSHL